jgi:hypothetical protein
MTAFDGGGITVWVIIFFNCKLFMHVKQQGSPHIVKTSLLSVDLRGKSGRLLKIDPNFNVSFSTTACSPTFHKTNVLHNNDLKRMQLMSQFGIKY